MTQTHSEGRSAKTNPSYLLTATHSLLPTTPHTLIAKYPTTAVTLFTNSLLVTNHSAIYSFIMGQYDELGQSKAALIKLANTKINQVNGHTTLWTGTLKETSDAETSDFKPSSYYGDYQIGPAERSEFHEHERPIAVCFSVPESVTNLSDSFTLTALDINPAIALLTEKEYGEYQAELHKRKQKLAAAASAKAGAATEEESHVKEETSSDTPLNDSQANQEPELDASTPRYTPTDSNIFVAANLIIDAQPEEYTPFSKAKADKVRECMRREMHWNISKERIRKLLLSRSRYVAMGEISVDTIAAAWGDLKEDPKEDLLPVRIVKGEAADKADLTPEQEAALKQEREDKKKADRLVLKRLAPPKPHLFHKVIAYENFEQKEGVKAKITFHEDPNDRSYMRLRFSLLYKDEQRKMQQPKHKLDIDLTYRNTRPRGELPKAFADTYKPTERIIDVSNHRFIPLLDKLFPHLARDNTEYWAQCYKSLVGGYKLYLLAFRQNELPMTNNLFTSRTDMPAKYYDLQIVMHEAPFVYILVRGTDIDGIAGSIVNRFYDLALYDPLSKFFVDVENPYINNKGIKDTASLPKFITLPENSFEDWNEYAIHCGVGTIIELRHTMGTHYYRGKASVLPVPHTQLKHGGKVTDCSYYVNFNQERSEQDLPRLTIDDHVSIDFKPEDITREILWKGRVVQPTMSTGIGQVCLVADRPIDPTGCMLDKESYSTLSATEMDSMTFEQLRAWAADNQTLTITLIKKDDEKECKRMCNGLSNMKVALKKQEEFPIKTHTLSQLRTFLMCKDHAQYDMHSLFETIHDYDKQAFVPLLRSSLLDYQNVPVAHWEDEGVTANIIVLGGVSGSGKTYTSINILCGYTLRIKVHSHKAVEQERDLYYLLKSNTKAKAEPTAKPAATSANDPADPSTNPTDPAPDTPEQKKGDDNTGDDDRTVNDDADSVHEDDLNDPEPIKFPETPEDEEFIDDGRPQL